jgi:hypothetical protein
MWWNFIGRILLGIYELLLAFMVIYHAELSRIPWLKFSFECQEGAGGSSIIVPQHSGWGFVTMQNVLVVLSAKFSYTVFYTIPFKMNRIKKT